MTRSKFDIAYNKWLQQVDADGGDAVWNEIQDELDFIETWDNISTNLDEVKPQKGKIIPMRYLKVLAAAAAIFLLLFLPVRYIIEQTNQPTVISELGAEADETGAMLSDQSTPLGGAEAESESDSEGIQRMVSEAPRLGRLNEMALASSSTNESIPAIESIEAEITAHLTGGLALHRIRNLPFDANNLLASNDFAPLNSIETEAYFAPQPSRSSGFSLRVAEVGLVYGYKNTWLLNHETRNGLNPGRLGNALPTFHQDIGLSSSLEINNRHLLGLEFLWKSEAGQKYQQYINASYVDRNIQLDYLKLQAFYIWESNRLPGQAIVGGYFARLTMAEEYQDKTRFRVEDRYSDLDYGLLAGYQLNIAFSNRIILKPGFRASYNLVNIFEGDDITPSHFKRTKNFSASFNVSLSYRFSE
jgi:hypothetical protein